MWVVYSLSTRRLGEAWDEFVSNGNLTVREIFHNPHLQKDWHTHDSGCFVFTIQGSSCEWFADRHFERPARSVLYRPAGARHRDLVGPQGARCLVLELPSISEAINPCCAALDEPRFFRLGAVAGLAERAYAEWLRPDCASELVIQALTLEMMAHLLRQNCTPAKAVPPFWLRRVKQRLDEGFSETPRLSELADIAGVHPTHLARQFRSQFGFSVGEYLRLRRIEKAKDLLVITRRSLTDIALDIGFSHHAHFTATFRRLVGISPSTFRRMFRSNQTALNRSVVIG